MWVSIIVISIVGTLAHFLYDLSNHNKIIGLFAAVNESTWEHIKIAITPTFLWGLYDGFIYGDDPNYFIAKLLSLLDVNPSLNNTLYASLLSAYNKSLLDSYIHLKELSVLVFFI